MGCRLWGHTESNTTEATEQQQQQHSDGCEPPWWLKFDPYVRKIPWEENGSPIPVFLSVEFLGQRSLAGYSIWGHNELDTTERLSLSLYPQGKFPVLVGKTALFPGRQFNDVRTLGWSLEVWVLWLWLCHFFTLDFRFPI